MTPSSVGARLGEAQASWASLCHSGPQHPCGIPIELFLMCFNFHFLLLENTDGDLLPPRSLSEVPMERELRGRHTHAPSHCWGNGSWLPSSVPALCLSFPICEKSLAEAALKGSGSPHTLRGFKITGGKRLQLGTGRNGHLRSEPRCQGEMGQGGTEGKA